MGWSRRYKCHSTNVTRTTVEGRGVLGNSRGPSFILISGMPSRVLAQTLPVYPLQLPWNRLVFSVNVICATSFLARAYPGETNTKQAGDNALIL